MRKTLLTLTLLASLGAVPALAAELRVDDDGQQCPDAAFTSIQAAVDAANPGDRVKVCPGTYTEQVTIGAGKDGVRLESQVTLGATIKAPAIMTEPGDIVRVTVAQNVKIKGFVITGPLPDALFCSLIARTGVRVDGHGSATIEKNHITAIRSTTEGFRGCQNGIGVLVGRMSEGQVGTATVRENLIDLYQKNGMLVDNTGTSAKVENNTVTSPGASEITAPNGIQVSRNATAEVRGNEVSGNVYTGAAAAAGTGILLFTLTGDVKVENNEVFANDDGISLYDVTGARIAKNRSHDNIVFDGFFADADSTGNKFESNQASGNTEHDCHDDSGGTGTAGTGNTWKGNKGQTATPAGICKP